MNPRINVAPVVRNNIKITAAVCLRLVLIILVQNSEEKAGTGAKEREEAARAGLDLFAVIGR